MVDADAVTRRIHQALRRYQPACVRVHCGERGASDIKVTAGGRKWATVVEAIPDDTDRVELLDKGGAILTAVDIEVAAAAGPELDGTAGEVARLMAIVTSAVDKQVERHSKLQDALVKELVGLCGILSQRLGSMERTFSDVLGLAYQSTRQAAAAEGSDEGKPGPADALVAQVLPMVMNQMGKNAAAAAGKAK